MLLLSSYFAEQAPEITVIWDDGYNHDNFSDAERDNYPADGAGDDDDDENEDDADVWQRRSRKRASTSQRRNTRGAAQSSRVTKGHAFSEGESHDESDGEAEDGIDDSRDLDTDIAPAHDHQQSQQPTPSRLAPRSVYSYLGKTGSGPEYFFSYTKDEVDAMVRKRHIPFFFFVCFWTRATRP